MSVVEIRWTKPRESSHMTLYRTHIATGDNQIYNFSADTWKFNFHVIADTGFPFPVDDHVYSFCFPTSSLSIDKFRFLTVI